MKLERIVLMMLIGKLSLEEVEYKPFNEVCEYIRGITYNKSQEAKEENENNWKVLRANNIDLQRKVLDLRDVKEVDSSVKVKESQRLRKNDILICAGSGSKEHIGKVAFITEDMDYTFGGFMAVIRVISEKINSRFLFHILAGNLFSEFLAKKLNVSTINNLNSALIKNFQIPLPPLPIQQEIVRILDTFTNLTAELTAELTARRKQYEYYRDELLTFGEDIERRTIGDVCLKIASGGTPATGKMEYYGGDIPWLRTQEVDWNDIWDTGVKISKAGLENSSAKWIPENCVVVAMYGATAAKVAVNRIPLTTNQACCNLLINEKIVMHRYVFYWLSKEYLHLKEMGQGSQSNINAKIIRNYLIPIPPMERQQYIVSILDRFRELCSAFRGISEEILLRQKQYEYYRDKLLNFREK